MGNTISSLENEEKKYLEEYLDINLKLDDEVSYEKKQDYQKEKNIILRSITDIKNLLLFVKYLSDNQDKLFEKDDDNWIFCIDDDSEYYFNDILSYLSIIINSYPDDVKSSRFYELVNNGDYITILNGDNFRGFNTLFIKKENGVIKVYFPEDAWGEDEFKGSGESNLPRQFLNESKKYPIEKWDILYHGSWANLSIKFLKSLNPMYFSDIKDIFDKINSQYLIKDLNNIISEYLFSEYTLNITMLRLEWGIFLFDISKKELFQFINNPDHSNYIIGFGEYWVSCIPDVWMDYIKETKQSFAGSLIEWDK